MSSAVAQSRRPLVFSTIMIAIFMAAMGTVAAELGSNAVQRIGKVSIH